MGEILNSIWNQLANMQWSDYLDILVVAFLIYKVLPLFRSADSGLLIKIMKVIETEDGNLLM